MHVSRRSISMRKGLNLNLRCCGTQCLERFRNHGERHEEQKHRYEYGDHPQLHLQILQRLEDPDGGDEHGDADEDDHRRCEGVDAFVRVVRYFGDVLLIAGTRLWRFAIFAWSGGLGFPNGKGPETHGAVNGLS